MSAIVPLQPGTRTAHNAFAAVSFRQQTAAQQGTQIIDPHIAFRNDFSGAKLKPDHEQRPIWICPNNNIFLETYSPIYKQAYDFLITISDPVSRPLFIHQYQMTQYSLYAAASLGLTTEDIIRGLERLSKNGVPQKTKDMVHKYTSKCGKVKLVLKNQRYYIESPYTYVLQDLIDGDEIFTTQRCDYDLTTEKGKRRRDFLEAEARKEELLAQQMMTNLTTTHRTSLNATDYIQYDYDPATGFIRELIDQDDTGIVLEGTGVLTKDGKRANTLINQRHAMGVYDDLYGDIFDVGLMQQEDQDNIKTSSEDDDDDDDFDSSMSDTSDSSSSSSSSSSDSDSDSEDDRGKQKNGGKKREGNKKLIKNKNDAKKSEAKQEEKQQKTSPIPPKPAATSTFYADSDDEPVAASKWSDDEGDEGLIVLGNAKKNNNTANTTTQDKTTTTTTTTTTNPSEKQSNAMNDEDDENNNNNNTNNDDQKQQKDDKLGQNEKNHSIAAKKASVYDDSDDASAPAPTTTTTSAQPTTAPVNNRFLLDDDDDDEEEEKQQKNKNNNKDKKSKTTSFLDDDDEDDNTDMKTTSQQHSSDGDDADLEEDMTKKTTKRPDKPHKTKTTADEKRAKKDAKRLLKKQKRREKRKQKRKERASGEKELRRLQEEAQKSLYLYSIEIKSKEVEKIRSISNILGYPMLEEFDFRNDKSMDRYKLPINLRPQAQIREYQEKALSKMFGNGRARSGIIVLPCGAGKTLVGITAMTTVGRSCLIVVATSVAAEQWKRQVVLWTTLPEKYIHVFSSGNCPEINTDAKVIIATYSMLAYEQKRSARAQKVMDVITGSEWGLLLLDEVHVAPADKFKKCITTTHSRCKLGLTATLVREDDKVTSLIEMIGPKLYEASWLDLSRQGYIATVRCYEVWCPMAPMFYEKFLHADHHLRRLLYICNPNKFQTLELLMRIHEARGDKIMVFCEDDFPIKRFSAMLGKKYLMGETSAQDRLKILSEFSSSPVGSTVFISKIGDNSIDLPDTNVIIQISAHYASRRQEAQRLGRILRPKSVKSGTVDAHFYTVISKDTEEMKYATKRQRFLEDQGYAYQILRQDYIQKNATMFKQGLKLTTESDQAMLLDEILKTYQARRGTSGFHEAGVVKTRKNAFDSDSEGEKRQKRTKARR